MCGTRLAATKLTKYYVVIEVDNLRTGYRKFRANADPNAKNEQSIENLCPGAYLGGGHCAMCHGRQDC